MILVEQASESLFVARSKEGHDFSTRLNDVAAAASAADAAYAYAYEGGALIELNS